jgi:hypothetical protein
MIISKYEKSILFRKVADKKLNQGKAAARWWCKLPCRLHEAGEKSGDIRTLDDLPRLNLAAKQDLKRQLSPQPVRRAQGDKLEIKRDRPQFPH